MRLALVIPWFGRDLKGGAEQQAWQIAARLAARAHDVEVLTTCCRSHQDDWETNHLPEGQTLEPEGFRIRRFRVEPRDRQNFDRACAYLQGIPRETLVPGAAEIPRKTSQVFTDELIKSSQLLAYLVENKTAYDWFLFLPYLYGPILKGISIVAERAALQPCLHDEAYAYMPEVAEAFHRAALLLFNSEGEQDLALRLFGPAIWQKSRLIGEGVEIAPTAAENTNTQPATPKGRFVLYLGRKDEGKNVPLLLSAFRRFRRVRPNSELRLVLAGHGVVETGSDRAIDLGLVSEGEKDSLLRSCAALFQPSENESFSRVMMEAWMHGKPVAAHASCLATAVAVQRARGGWVAANEDAWAELFVQVDRLPAAQLQQLGAAGRNYADTWANWEQVMERYEKVLTAAPAIPLHTAGAAVRSFGPVATINQFLPNLSFGDAISNQAIAIRNQLRELGFQSEIYVRYIDPLLAAECHAFAPESLNSTDALIYHHSTGSEITPHVLSFSGPKCLIYHNITPAEFFEPFWPEHAAVLRRGREDLSKLATHFPISYGVSEYNALELAASGFQNPGVLPLSVDPAKWAIAPDAQVMRQIGDGRTNILFVGRIAPNKRQDELAIAFERYLALDPTARLILLGKPEPNDPYPLHVTNTIRALGIEDSVLLPGRTSDAELAAYWRTATLFWSMSEHEGFCVPLIEAMWFDVPVLAFAAAAVPETLGSAGLMFSDKSDVDAVAALARVAIADSELRRSIITAQRARRAHYLPEIARGKLEELVERLTETRIVKRGVALQQLEAQFS